MTDDEWEKQRSRAVMAAFQTGRPVFADSDGVLRFTDGAQEQVSEDVGVSKSPVPRVTIYTRAIRASRVACIASIVVGIANGVAGIWHPWQFALVPVFAFSAIVWHRVNRGQRALYGARR